MDFIHGVAVKTNMDDQLVLDKFQPRPYQETLLDLLFNEPRAKRIHLTWPRRAGKDICLFNAAIRQCLLRTCMVTYILPNFGSARRCIWEAIAIGGDNDGMGFLDYIPPRLITNKNKSELTISFVNGSKLCLVGSESHSTSLRGTNPILCILSEFAYMDDAINILDTITPILAANGGQLVIATTPNGKNFNWQLAQMAQELPDWTVIHKTVYDTKHMTDEALDLERRRMSPEKFAQEYECSYERGVQGAIFGDAIDKLKMNGQVTSVSWEPGLLVHCAIDIGVNDATTIIWFQVVGEGTVVRIIDCYSNRNLGLDHYAKILQDKPYRYGNYYAPHDLAVREWGGGAITRYEKARQLGINFKILEQISVEDSIENVLTHFPKFWIDKDKCRTLVDAIENYYKEWDESKQTYKSKPVHNWASDYCFTADTIILTRNGMRHIIDIKENDEILTLMGWMKCSQSIMTRRNADLVEVTFQDGMKVKCTPDHLFLTENGWISAQNLQKGFKIQSSLMYSFSTSTDTSIVHGPVINILPKVEQPCIEKFGEGVTEIFLLNHIYTIWTRIIRTITFGTWYAFPKKNTERLRDLILKDSVKHVEQPLTSGTLQKKDDCGTNDKQLDQRVGRNGKENQENVCIVKKNIKALSDQMDMNKNSAIQTARLLTIESVENLSQPEDVYCINVPVVGHFSLSNGAIVKNCDALRYMCQSIHKAKKGRSGEEFEQARRDAMYGNKFKQQIFNHDPRYDR